MDTLTLLFGKTSSSGVNFDEIAGICDDAEFVKINGEDDAALEHFRIESRWADRNVRPATITIKERIISQPRLSLAFKLLRWVVYTIGDTRWLGWRNFPFLVTWDVHQHRIDLNEVIHGALPKLQPGDILLHRDEGFVSNAFIGGGMIHAGLYVGNGQLVEAVSEGVVKRHAAHLLYSDYACVVRPRLDEKVRPAATAEAIQWAERIVGFPYDVLFDFCSEDDRRIILECDRKTAIRKRVRFCCTEIPHFCYLGYLEALNIQRRRNVSFLTRVLGFLGVRPGEAVVDADMYLQANFDVVWCSRSMTVNWCRRKRMRREVIDKVERYWAEKGPVLITDQQLLKIEK